MHLNWLQALGGDLSGTLPNPRLAASSFLQGQIFGAKPSSALQTTNSSSVVLEAQIFGRKQIAQIDLNDAQTIEKNQVFGNHAVSWMPTPVNDTQMIQAGRIFGNRDLDWTLQMRILQAQVAARMSMRV